MASVFTPEPNTRCDPSVGPGQDAAATPLVSIVIPCYNQARYLGEAIESALKQTYSTIEVVVVDDSSTDHTALVAQSFLPVRYVHQPNGGVAAARNKGFELSHGEYVLFLDADDRLLPHAVESGLRLLQAHPRCAFAFGSAYYVNQSSTRRDRHLFPCNLTERIFPQLLECNFIANPAMVLYHRWALVSIGAFDVAVSASADYDLYLRISWLHPVAHHDEPVVEYRRHEHNMSNDPCLMLDTTLTVLSMHYPQFASIPALAANYRRGLAFWKDFYGEQIVMGFYEHLRAGHIRQCLRCLTTLARWYPERLAQPGTKLVQNLMDRYKSLPR